MNVRAIIKGALLALFFSTVCILCISALVYFNLLQDSTASIIVFASGVISCFLGAFGTSRVCDRKILFNALSVGILFCIILFLISVSVNNSIALHTKTAALMGSIISASVLGAIFGK